MKYLLILSLTVSLLYANNLVKAQNPTQSTEELKTKDKNLESSIVYIEDVLGQKMNKKSKYPSDLSVKSLYFIEIGPDDIKYDVGFMALKYDGINKKLITEMKEAYPYKFQSFTNEYYAQNKQYFLDKGFKYRLIIHSIFENYIIYENNVKDEEVIKQRFSIKIVDIEKNIVYGTDDWYWHYNYVGKFIKNMKQ